MDKFGAVGIKFGHEEPQPTTHQERVNAQMFKAIELLGRKLERAEMERDRVVKRLIQIESSATVDERTGKLYLPVAMEGAGLPQTVTTAAAVSRWAIGTSLLSSAIAFLAVGLVLFREPPPALTQEQLAALNMISTQKFAQLDDKAWKQIAQDEKTAETATETVPETTMAQSSPRKLEVFGPPAPTQLAVIPPIPTVESKVEPAAGDAAKPETQITPSTQTQQTAKTENTKEDSEIKKIEQAAKPVSSNAEVAKNQPVAVPAPKNIDVPAAKKEAKEIEGKQNSESASSAPIVTTQIEPDKNLPAKLAILEKRAFDGVPEAQHDLATIYASGKAVAQDYKRAVYWFARAADNGIANADYNMGVMFQQGLGVTADLPKAIAWYQRAADLGHPEAMYNLGIAHVEGIGTKRDVQTGVAYFKRAANAGIAQAAYNLGVLYESSFIGVADTGKALEWYAIAQDEGHADAAKAIARLKGKSGDAADGMSNDSGLPVANIETSGGEVGEGDASPSDEARADSSNLVTRIQEMLMEKGYLPKAQTSGVLDNQTKSAIMKFQSQQKMTADGTPSQSLLDRLLVAPVVVK